MEKRRVFRRPDGTGRQPRKMRGNMF